MLVQWLGQMVRSDNSFAKLPLLQWTLQDQKTVTKNIWKTDVKEL